MANDINYSEDGDIGRITLSISSMNAFTGQSIHELNRTLQDIENSPPTVLVIESDSSDAFSVGIDIYWMNSVDTSVLNDGVIAIQRTLQTLEELPAITIAGVNGHCLGTGFELLLCCDFRLISDQTSIKLGLNETRLGIIPPGGTLRKLMRDVGKSVAFEMAINQRHLSPREAYELNLVQEIYEPDAFKTTVDDYAERIAAGPSRAYTAIKQALTKGPDMGMREQDYEKELEKQLFETDDFREGLDAFTSNRTPDFSNRHEE
jgi:enoyl-CoA hydratase